MDYTGNSAILTTIGVMAIGGIIGAVVSAASSALSQKALTGYINWTSVGVAAATGLVSGAVAASPLGIGYQIGIGGALGVASYVADCYANNKPVNLGEVGVAIVAGSFSGAIGGPGANKGMVITDAIEYTGKIVAREARRSNRAYAAKAIARATYYSSNVVASSAWEASIRFSAGCGASNTLTGKLGGMGIFSSCPTISLW